ncbi:MAG: FtsW/RodA/SpoVE family cell cycle protein [Candidatus Aminicenantes bacterium]|nr:FtsW/RodA/SpoVE family cell cycle protein [Candidatus Aminicenantes bacterium]
MKDYFKYFDKLTFVLLLLLSLIGIVLIFSAGSPLKESDYIKQMVWLFVSLAGFFIVFSLKIDFVFRNALTVYLGLLFILALQVVAGRISAGTKSWFRLGAVGMQFSEFVKIPLALVLAKTMVRFQQVTWKTFILLILLVAGPVCLIILQPDLGVSFILCSFIPIIILLKKIRPLILITSLILALLCGAIGWNSLLKDYQKNRIISFMNPSKYKTSIGYQIIQSKIAIGSGGLSGKGYLKGSQSQYQFLPARHTDFIISVIGEELGFISIAVLFFIFFIIFYRQFKFNFQSDEEFYFIYLFNGLILFQFLINVAMAIGLFPVLGISLPFVSYGGSSLLSFYIGEAIILRIKINNYLT